MVSGGEQVGRKVLSISARRVPEGTCIYVVAPNRAHASHLDGVSASVGYVEYELLFKPEALQSKTALGYPPYYQTPPTDNPR
jgi:hypothetical protein